MIIPLRVYSEYSLLTSCIKPAHAIEYCIKNNLHSIAMADQNNMFGAMSWSLSMLDAKIKPIIGCNLKVKSEEESSSVWVFCKNEIGYQELSHVLSESYLLHEGVAPLESIKALRNCVVLADHELADEQIIELSKSGLDFALAISRQKDEADHESRLFGLSNRCDIPIVAAPKFFFAKENEHLAAEALWCIKNNTYLAETDRPRVPDDAYFKAPADLEKMFADIPQAITNCEIIVKKCNFALHKHAPRMPGLDTDKDPAVLMKQMVQDGLEFRLKEYVLPLIPAKQHDAKREEYQARLDYEFAMIEKMGFCPYFLIVAEIVQWAKRNDVPVGPGRGSGASCLTAWCLQITDIDPMQFHLMFERFLNPDRVSLPDFDIDFCQENRHRVIEYIQQRFGKDNVAHIITFGSLQYRAAVRDIGRVMQLPYSKVDDICKRLPPPVQGVAPTIKELRESGRLAEFITDDTKELFMIAESVEGLPRHSSVHAAGLVIGNQRLADIVPLFKDPHLEIPIIQFSMKPAEQIGLVKFDILGLSVLSTLQKTCQLLKARNIDLKLSHLPLDDAETFEMLQQGKVKAVFQLDSPGFRQLMLEMKPTCFEDIIAAGALYRPGPMVDIPQFVRCKNNMEKAEYLYEQMEPILKDTYGVIVYQEQVLQIAKEMAGYSLKDADLLRRAMGKKIKSEMAKHQEQFIEGILKVCQGPREKAEALFEKLARFASYGFPKAHAAPYAVMTYQTAYCKYHYPAEFFCATLFYEHMQEKAEEIIQDAKKFGVPVLGPNLNMSAANFSLKDGAILYGLSCVKGVGEIANQIVADRDLHGPFKSIDDFIQRVNPNKKVLENFVFSGAFDCFGDIRSKQMSQVLKPHQEQTLTLFDDLDEEAPVWNELDIIKGEFDTMHTIFHPLFADMHMQKFSVYTKLADVQKAGSFVCAIGLKDNIRKTKDGRVMHSYKFIDQNGVQEILTNQAHNAPEWHVVMVEIERSDVRYTARNVITIDKFFARYRKMFISVTPEKYGQMLQQIQTLPEGETSIYLEDNIHNKKELVGNFMLDLVFVQNVMSSVILLV